MPTTPSLIAVRRSIRLPGSLLLLTAAACGGHVAVQSAVAPDAKFVRLRNFTVLQPKELATAAAASTDPMLRDRITLHTVSFELLLALQSRGYFADTAAPDIAAAYYVASRLPVDTAVFGYGYTYAPNPPFAWWHDEPAALTPAQPDSQGTIIVDVLSPTTKVILWRGEGVVRRTANQALYVEALKKAVRAIVDEFPGGIGGGAIAPHQVEHGGRPR